MTQLVGLFLGIVMFGTIFYFIYLVLRLGWRKAQAYISDRGYANFAWFGSLVYSWIAIAIPMIEYLHQKNIKSLWTLTVVMLGVFGIAILFSNWLIFDKRKNKN